MNFKHRLLSLLFLVVTPILAFAQISDPTQTAPRQYTIAAINVVGADVQTQSFVIASASLDVGDVVQIPGPQIADAIRRIYRSGLFSEVEIYQTGVIGDRVTLEIRVKEQPRLDEYELEGIRRGQRRELREKLNLLSGFAITEAMISQAKGTIRRYYEEKGYSEVTIQHKFGRLDTLRNRQKLTFDIELGRRIQIERIEIKGNTAFSDRKIRKELKEIKVNTWWRVARQTFQQTKYETAIENMTALYRKNGYRDFYVEKDTVYVYDHSKRRKGVAVEMTVYEGPQYRIRNITWEGNTVYPDEALTAALDFNSGDIYNESKLQENLTANKNSTDVTSLYHDGGYLFFRFEQDVTLAPDNQLDLTFLIAEDEIAKVRAVTFSGNTKTNDDVVRRTLRSVPGQNYNRTAIIRTVRELATLGYFTPEKITPNLEPNFERKTVDVDFALDESVSTDNFEFSGGFGGRQFGVILSSRVNFNNFSAQNIFNKEAWSPLPGGDGQKLSLGIQITGGGYRNYNFSFMEPWFMGRPNSFGFGTSYSFYRYTSTQKYEQFTSYLSYGRRLQWPDDYFTHTSTLQYQMFDVFRQEGFIEPGAASMLSIKQILERNSLDNPISPSYGSKFTLAAEFAPPLGEFRQFYKINTAFQNHIPVVGKLVFTNGFDYGFLGWFSDEKKSQFSRFYLGGTPLQQQQTFYRENIDLKGYPGGFNGSISPYIDGREVGGTIYSKYFSELRYPAIANEQVQVMPYVFAEAGNAYIGFRDFDPFSVKRSAGFGTRLFLPILGLIDLSYGYRFDGIDGAQFIQPGKWEFLFNIGAPF